MNLKETEDRRGKKDSEGIREEMYYVPSCRGGRAQNMLPERHELRACILDAAAAAARFNGATDIRRAAMFTMFISSTRAATRSSPRPKNAKDESDGRQ